MRGRSEPTATVLPAVWLFSLILLPSAPGCCPRYTSHLVAVSLDEQFTNGGRDAYPKVEVHLFGVSEDAYQRYANASVTDWFSGDEDKNRERTALYNAGLLKVISLGPGRKTGTLSKDDPVWDKWFGNQARYLFVLTNMPPEHADAPGAQDPRRAILSLNACERKDITLVIDASGVRTAEGK